MVSRKKDAGSAQAEGWDSIHLPRKPWSLTKRVSFLSLFLCQGALQRVGLERAEAEGGREKVVGALKQCWRAQANKRQEKKTS